MITRFARICCRRQHFQHSRRGSHWIRLTSAMCGTGISGDGTKSPSVLSTNELEIDGTAMTPTGYGGHSLVYKVNAKGFPNPAVLKIFRFTIPPNPNSKALPEYIIPRDLDYSYFLSENSCYSRLQALQDQVYYTPKLYTAVTIPTSFEQHLLPSYSAHLHRRKRQAQLKLQGDQVESLLPLKGILIEYIPGIRLSNFSVVPSAISDKILSGINHVHSHGILHRDIKKRNVIIVPNDISKLSAEEMDGESATSHVLDGSEKVIWIDFSNSLTVDDFRNDNGDRDMLFAQALEEEKTEVEKMIIRLNR